MSDLKLVLFDCDGTLVDSAAIIHQCMQETFNDFDMPLPSFAQTRSIIGLSLNEAIAKLLDKNIDEETASMVVQYKNNYNRSRLTPQFNEPLFSGIVDLLNMLRKRPDVLLGMVTGKSRHGVEIVCKAHRLNDFIAIRTADDCPSKPHPAMVLECCGETGVPANHCIVVGDAIYDMQMAKAAGAKAIGVSWGYHSIQLLQQAGADDILDKPDDLLKLIEN